VMGSLDPVGWTPVGNWSSSRISTFGAVKTSGTDSLDTFSFFSLEGTIFFCLEKGFEIGFGSDEVLSKLLILALQL